MSAIWDNDDPNLYGDGLLTMLVLADNTQDDGACEVAIKRLDRRLRLTRADTISILLMLEKMGYVTIGCVNDFSFTGTVNVFADDKRCAKCGTGFHLTIDHVTPKSWGGSDEPGNLQWLCRSCNSSKGNRHATRY